MTDDRERTPLHEASEAGDMEAVSLLLRLCADINAVDKDGRTALHYAVQRHFPEVIMKLISAGAKVDVEDNRRTTPLNEAKRQGYQDIVKILQRKEGEILRRDEKSLYM